MNPAQWVVPVTSGMLVSLIIALLRTAWTRRRVPTGLTRAVTRGGYLSTILQRSQDPDVRRLEALVPNLTPAAGSAQLESIQRAWQDINGRAGARIITRESQDCLTAGAELLSKGIETRVAQSLNTDNLSYHVFGGVQHSVVVNYRDGGRDRPSRLNGLSPSKIFHSHFENVWQTSSPLESVLAEQILRGLPRDASPDELAEQILDVRAKYRLDGVAEEAALRHLAFRHSAPVIFVTGLPGAGKSLVRRRLAHKLTAMRLQVEELTDYVFAFGDFLYSAIKLDASHGEGFYPDIGGAFRVDTEKRLEPALHALAKRVWENRGRSPITLVEFARADLVGALQVFGDEVLASAQVVHVRASAEVRAVRLEARAKPPRIQVMAPTGINVEVSDDHRLPSTAAKSLYTSEDFTRLAKHRGLVNRIHQLDNEANDPTEALLDAKLDDFVDTIVRPYRTLAANAQVSSGPRATPPLVPTP